MTPQDAAEALEELAQLARLQKYETERPAPNRLILRRRGQHFFLQISKHRELDMSLTYLLNNYALLATTQVTAYLDRWQLAGHGAPDSAS